MSRFDKITSPFRGKIRGKKEDHSRDLPGKKVENHHPIYRWLCLQPLTSFHFKKQSPNYPCSPAVDLTSSAPGLTDDEPCREHRAFCCNKWLMAGMLAQMTGPLHPIQQEDCYRAFEVSCEWNPHGNG